MLCSRSHKLIFGGQESRDWDGDTLSAVLERSRKEADTLPISRWN